MDDVRIGDLLFTNRCDIEGMDVKIRDQKKLGTVVFQVVDISAFTVRYLGVREDSKTKLVPAELILDADIDGLILDFDEKTARKLVTLPEKWQEVFDKEFEQTIYNALEIPPYWKE